MCRDAMNQAWDWKNGRDGAGDEGKHDTDIGRVQI